MLRISRKAVGQTEAEVVVTMVDFEIGLAGAAFEFELVQNSFKQMRNGQNFEYQQIDYLNLIELAVGLMGPLSVY